MGGWELPDCILEFRNRMTVRCNGARLCVVGLEVWDFGLKLMQVCPT